ncbi:hypothetical protein [Caenispirillum salinarum]|uniref:hypothetical protein n=1 Tax=Caenispirillum salinarum TaxID=859058 RepID=UPI003850D9EE
MPAFLTAVQRLIRDSLRVWWVLLRMMVPIMIAVKVAAEMGAIPYIAAAFAPVMDLAGLPAEVGVVWAAACLTTIYGAAAVLPTVLPDVSLTVAQMTVLGTMILVAHSLPVEGRVCQRAGAGIIFQTLLRLVAALLFGIVLNAVYGGLGVLQEPVTISWLPEADPDAGWTGWAVDSAIGLGWIYLIILAIMAGMALLDAVGANRLLTRLLSPLLRVMGIGEKAVPLTVIGVLLGISYGGGLIIREVERGGLSRRDVLLSISFMALCHSLIEDSLIIIALGGHWSGVIIGRLVLTLVVIAVLARIVHRMSDETLARLFLSRVKIPDPAPEPAAATTAPTAR